VPAVTRVVSTWAQVPGTFDLTQGAGYGADRDHSENAVVIRARLPPYGHRKVSGVRVHPSRISNTRDVGHPHQLLLRSEMWATSQRALHNKSHGLAPMQVS
jgi:hypothetical protein